MVKATKKAQRKGWEKILARRGMKGKPQTSRTASKQRVIRGPSKYHAVPTMAHGIRFDSKKEAWRYLELLLLAKAGKISGLQLQPRFDLLVDARLNPNLAGEGEHIEIGTYVADFSYSEHMQLVVEDVKGFKTPLYRWKKKHVEAQYGIVIREL